MKSLRFFLAIATILLLACGYSASQFYALNGFAPDWAKIIDKPPVVLSALILFCVALLSSIFGERGEDEGL